MSIDAKAAVAGVILAIAVIVPFAVAVTPSRHRDPQDGMAIGFLIFVSFVMLIPAGLLAWGHFGGHPMLVKVIFWIVVVVATYVGVMLTAMTVVERSRARERERRGTTESLTSQPPPPML